MTTDNTEADAEDGSKTMDDDTGSTGAESGSTTGNEHAEGHGSDIPEESPSSESNLSLSNQVDQRESDSEQTE